MTESGLCGRLVSAEPQRIISSECMVKAVVEQEAPEQSGQVVEKIREEFASFQKTMEELYLLKRVSRDLRSYRRMIRLKRYD